MPMPWTLMPEAISSIFPFKAEETASWDLERGVGYSLRDRTDPSLTKPRAKECPPKSTPRIMS